jgi:hypothetical protein
MPSVLLLPLVLLCILTAPLSIHAENKVLTAEATYTMGEGETMTFAEAMALQKAKQMALEQAGTYLQSYAKIQNYQLTSEEIQTIAGGILQVEVLDKTRTLVGDGVKFFVKIKATVTTDKVADLAQRIKGKNIADEYRKLQEEYARLGKEIETWKQLVAKTPAGPERDAALNQIREREKAFAVAQKREAAFYQRLVSGEILFSRAMDQLSKKQFERSIVDALFHKIQEQGFVIALGEPEIQATLRGLGEVEVSIPVTLKAAGAIRSEVKVTTQSLGGKIIFGAFGTTVEISRDSETNAHFERRLRSLSFALDVVGDNGHVWSCQTSEWTASINPIADLLDVRISSFTVKTWIPLKEAKRINKIQGKFIESAISYPCGVVDKKRLREP